MQNREESVTQSLLHSNDTTSENTTMNSAVIENEKSGNGSKGGVEKEPDLRLHDAVCDPDNIEEIENLIEEEPNLLYERDDSGRVPLITVAIDADESAPEIAKILLGVSETQNGTLVNVERPQLLNLQDSINYTALHYSAFNQQEPLVSALLRWGADPYIQDRRGNTCFHLCARGMTELAVQCAKRILQHDLNRQLTNMTNVEEKTALHMAVDERSLLMTRFLLQPENKLDISKKDSKGWNILHYICSGTDESDAVCDIVKEIVSRCNESQINHQDIKLRTPLILAAMQRLPKIVEILVNEDKTDVLRSDEEGRTALHYAAMNGCYPKGSRSVDILIRRKFQKKGQVLKYLYLNEDKQGHTPFMYACINCPTETVQQYMGVVKDPYDWMTGTYANLLYKHCPSALTGIMDQAFTEDTKRSAESNDEILVDYGPITGYTDTVEPQPQQETHYLKRALYWDYESQKDVLLHPLVQLFIVRKWHKLRWIILTWVIWQLVWLAAYTALVVSFYANSETHHPAVAIVASLIMLVYVFSSLVNEGFELYTVKCTYLYSLTNLTQVAQNFLALIAISPLLSGSEEPQIWQKYATATGILLAYILSMRDIGKLHNKIGLVVEVLKQVLIQIVHVLLCCAPLWIGFTLAFVVIFDDDEALNSTFPGPIVKVLVMMTGEFEYNDTFKDEEGDEKGKSMAIHRVVRLLFFLSFLISVPVAFFNLLTGFALDKVMELRERAKVGRIAKQLEHIYFIESILLTLRPLGKIVPFFSYENCMRQLNVATAWLDQKLKFHTIIREQVRRQERRHLNRKQIQGCLAGMLPSFCPGRIPDEVEDHIFALATRNSNPELQKEKCPTCFK